MSMKSFATAADKQEIFDCGIVHYNVRMGRRLR